MTVGSNGEGEAPWDVGVGVTPGQPQSVGDGITLREGAHLEVAVCPGWGHAAVYTVGPSGAPGPGTSSPLFSADHRWLSGLS